jgi:succinate dehydrogenase / fumarate reductase, cytochrome b subunit
LLGYLGLDNITAMSVSSLDFFRKNEFLIRRLHSLTGLIPVGAYMVVHLLVNASLLNGPATFQSNVNSIHALGLMLPLVEWFFILLPLIFHAAIGVWIIRTGKSNHENYRFVNNWRYTLQRWSGMIAIVFIFLHISHLHGWFHNPWWLHNVAEPLGMAQFRAYNAASTLGQAMTGFVWPVLYFVGILASVFHLANGIWTMGITWGVWVSPNAQRRATYVCGLGGFVLLLVGMTALTATLRIDVEEARRIEDAMYEARVAAGDIVHQPHKRFFAEDPPEFPEDGSQADGSHHGEGAAKPDLAADSR